MYPQTDIARSCNRSRDPFGIPWLLLYYIMSVFRSRHRVLLTIPFNGEPWFSEVLMSIWGHGTLAVALAIGRGAVINMGRVERALGGGWPGSQQGLPGQG